MSNILQDAVDNWPEDEATGVAEFALSIGDEADRTAYIEKEKVFWRGIFTDVSGELADKDYSRFCAELDKLL